jgi:hypothetical protein
MATLLCVDGTKKEVKPANGRSFKIEEVYSLIGNGCNMVQAIRVRDGRLMLMDEDAKSRRPVPDENLEGNAMLMGIIALDDTLVGNVLLVADEEFD